MIKYRCSYCSADMESPDSLVGEFEKCPRCKRSVRIPEVVRDQLKELADSAKSVKSEKNNPPKILHRKQSLFTPAPTQDPPLRHYDHSPSIPNTSLRVIFIIVGGIFIALGTWMFLEDAAIDHRAIQALHQVAARLSMISDTIIACTGWIMVTMAFLKGKWK